MTIGLKTGIVRLSEYDHQWQTIFEKESLIIKRSLGPHILDIQHIGSTAIPKSIAKPIIDIGIAIQNFEKGKQCISLLEKLGYTYKGENGIPKRHYFEKEHPKEIVTHHIHIFEKKSAEWKRHLYFRDILLRDTDIAQEYNRIKKTLSEKYGFDREKYQEGKSKFIQAVINGKQR